MNNLVWVFNNRDHNEIGKARDFLGTFSIKMISFRDILEQLY